MIGVFARRDHPPGYGFNDRRAHGYVVLFVKCEELEDFRQVVDRLGRQGEGEFRGIPPAQGYGEGNLGEWYGGPFDLVATIPGWPEVMVGRYIPSGRFVSLGDNRFVGYYTAEEVLTS